MAQVVPSHFAASHDTYNSIGVASGASSGAGQVLYVLSSALPEQGAKLFAAPLHQSPRLEQTRRVADLTAACQDPPSCVVQGKAHVPLVEDPTGAHVYFASHVGFYTEVDGMETLPVPPGRPAHLAGYPGGCVLQLEVATSALRAVARLPDGEGVITMAADLPRSTLYCLSWPSGWMFVVRLDGTCRRFEYPGRGHGEASHPRTGHYRPVCRSMAVDPRSGCVYWSNSKGDVLCHDGGAGGVSVVLSGEEGLVRDYFGHFDPCAPGSMGYHWRQVQWVSSSDSAAERGTADGCILGVHGNSGYLFRLWLPGPAETPFQRPRLDVLERLTSRPSRRGGMADQFSYGYLGFAVARGVVFYLTGGPVYAADGRRVAGKATTAKGESRGAEHLHLVTFALGSGICEDHGPIFLDDRLGYPTYVNSLAIGGDGWLYALGRMPDGLTELFRIRDPTAPAD